MEAMGQLCQRSLGWEVVAEVVDPLLAVGLAEERVVLVGRILQEGLAGAPVQGTAAVLVGMALPLDLDQMAHRAHDPVLVVEAGLPRQTTQQVAALAVLEVQVS
jgi:hypothetical protein